MHYGLEMETEVEIETIVKRSVISGRYEAWVIVGVMGVMRGDNNEKNSLVIIWGCWWIFLQSLE